jgi:hypothetical protein
VGHVDLDAEDLTERGGQIGVEADDGLVVLAERLERRVKRLGADLDDTGLFDVDRQPLIQGRVRLRRRYRRFGLWLLAGLPASRDGASAIVTAIANAAASPVRRRVLVVMM